MEVEFGNITAAHRDAVLAGLVQDGLRIASALWWFWSSTDRRAIGREWIERGLRDPGELPDRIRARALTVLGYLAGQQLDFDAATAAGQAAVALAGRTGDELDLAWAQQALGLTREGAGEHVRAAELLSAARQVLDAAGAYWLIAANELVGGIAAVRDGDLEKLDRCSREALRRADLVGYEPFRCWAHLLRCRLAERRGNLEAARIESGRAVAGARLVQLAHYVAFALVQHAVVAARGGDAVGAEAVLREAITLADDASAGWFAALARLRLAQLLFARGDSPGGRQELELIVAASRDSMTSTGREYFFLVLGGDPIREALRLLELRA